MQLSKGQSLKHCGRMMVDDKQVPTQSAAHQTVDAKPALQPGFDREYARYKQLCAEMDGMETMRGKRVLFKTLTGLLDRMEIGIMVRGEKA